MTAPYVLAVASQKGGTGRTTAALALAWTWGRAGKRVTLLDADPVGAATLVAGGSPGACRWTGVRLASFTGADWPNLDAEIVLVDCPSLTESAARPILARADGVLLTCLPDLLALRTLAAATSALRAARQSNPRLEVLGLLVGILHEADAGQQQVLAQLRQLHAGLLLEPPLPFRPEVRDWPLAPGSDLPAGPARLAYAAVAESLLPLLRPRSAAV
ncbi:MAG: ParA family protein [Planctomycetia bacterium]|nr:ParA family protein [Planctomycetia bacterium]